MSKGEKVGLTIRRNRERRSGMRIAVYQLKLQNISKRRFRWLDLAYLEAKWLYNWLLEDPARLSLPANKIHRVVVKVGEGVEERSLSLLGSQVKQSIADRLREDLGSLKAQKEQGRRVGRLRFKSRVCSIPLKQYGVTYELDFRRNRVRIQKLGRFRVLGLHQIPRDAEIAKADLVRKPSGFYLHVTCYLPKGQNGDQRQGELKSLPPVGADLGLRHKVTLSNRLRIDFEVPETERLKRLQRRLNRAQKGSCNRRHILELLRREHEKVVRRRTDAQNKVIAFLKLYRAVAYQDDPVEGWKAHFGRRVQRSGIGRLKERLRNGLSAISVERFEPTTQECHRCGARRPVGLEERIFACPECGLVMDRDLNAARMILRKGFGLEASRALGVDRAEVTPMEIKAAARILRSNPWIRVSLVEEVGSPGLKSGVSGAGGSL